MNTLSSGATGSNSHNQSNAADASPKPMVRSVPLSMLAKLAALAPVKAKRPERLAVPARTPHIDSSEINRRAGAYLTTIPPAVSGQRGHDSTFRAACKLVLGFDLTPDAAFPLLAEWNTRCDPPWSEGDLLRKLDQANKQQGPRGFLLDSPPPESSVSIAPAILDDICGPPPHVDKCDSLPSPVASIMSPCCDDKLRVILREEQGTREQVGGDSRAIDLLIGKQPWRDACPKRVPIAFRGDTCDGHADRVCGMWDCYTCRCWWRWNVRNTHIPIAYDRATHQVETDAEGWDRLRQRLKAAGLKCENHWLLRPDGGRLYTLEITGEVDVERFPELTEARGVVAAIRLAKATEEVPADIPARTRKVGMSQGWKPKKKPVEVEAKEADGAPSFSELPVEESYATEPSRPIRSTEEMASFLKQIGVRYEWDGLTNAHRGGALVSSITWERPENPELLAAIRHFQFGEFADPDPNAAARAESVKRLGYHGLPDPRPRPERAEVPIPW